MGLDAACGVIAGERALPALVVSRRRREAQNQPGKGHLEQPERAERKQEGACPGENGGEQDPVG